MPHTDPWSRWRAWLANPQTYIVHEPGKPPAELWPDGFIPGAGYFATSDWKPVAIWPDPDLGREPSMTEPKDWLCQINGKRADPARAWRDLTHRRTLGIPVTYEDFKFQKATGKFPGQLTQEKETARITPAPMPVAATAEPQERKVDGFAPSPGVGHNEPPEGLPDTPEAILHEVEEYDRILNVEARQPDVREESGFLRLSRIKDKVMRLEQKAIELFTIEKEPSLRISQAIDIKWRDAKTEAGKVKKRAMKAADLYIEANNARIAAERAKAAAQAEAGIKPLPMMDEPSRPKGGMRIVKVDKVDFVDLPAFCAWYAAKPENERHASFNTVVGTIAARLVAAGIKEMPGVVVREELEAR